MAGYKKAPAAHQVPLPGYESKVYLDYKDIMAILGVKAAAAYQIIHALPHIQSGNGGSMRIRKALFADYLARKEEETAILQGISDGKYITLEGREYHVLSRRGKRLVLALVPTMPFELLKNSAG
ncbi:MAG: hypothetical protein LBR76_00060 [Oscillospiraceae bacterium]|jgi:hypothetical protein|nr:hypothetical protein [Oscillospiraceae bacterium]